MRKLDVREMHDCWAPPCGPWPNQNVSQANFLEPLVVRAGSAIERYTKQKPNIENRTVGSRADLD